MKKSISFLLALLVLSGSCAALAQTAQPATALPCGVTFGMSMDEATGALGAAAEDTPDEMDGEVGSLYIETAENAFGSLAAYDLTFEVNRSNSAKAPRLNMIFCGLPVGDSVIASFRDALTAFTALYGAPDGDPFDESGVDGYREYGYRSATWTKPDVRINLSLSRMYQATLTLDFANRLCYDADDLKAE